MIQINGEELRHLLPLLIPIVAIVMGVTAGIVAMVADFRKKRIMFELHHKERMAAIERGMEVPPLDLRSGNFVAGGASPYGGIADFRDACVRRRGSSGIVLIFVGLGWMLAEYLNNSDHFPVWSVVVVAWGLGKIVRDFYERNLYGPPPSPPAPPAPPAS